MRLKFFTDAKRLKDWLDTHEKEAFVYDIEIICKNDDGGHGFLMKYVWV